VSVTQASFDDAVVSATVAIRLCTLLRDTGELRNAVQVARSALRRLQATRDASVSQAVFATSRPDDQLALSAASVSCFFDISTAAAVARRPGAGAYGGAGLFGASSQVRTLAITSVRSGCFGRAQGVCVPCSRLILVASSWRWKWCWSQ
jgi:hypothetical protein